LKKNEKVLLCSEIEQFPEHQEITLGIASFGGVFGLNKKVFSNPRQKVLLVQSPFKRSLFSIAGI